MTGGFYTDPASFSGQAYGLRRRDLAWKRRPKQQRIIASGSSRRPVAINHHLQTADKRRRFTCWKNYVPVRVKFLIAVAIIFVAAVSIISEAAFQGVVDQYDLPMDEWSVSMFVIQGAWVFIYSLMFTIIGSLPFAFWFLGPRMIAVGRAGVSRMRRKRLVRATVQCAQRIRRPAQRQPG
jgi:hypothetical protein